MRDCVEFISKAIFAHHFTLRGGTYQILDLAEQFHLEVSSREEDHPLVTGNLDSSVSDLDK